MFPDAGDRPSTHRKRTRDGTLRKTLELELGGDHFPLCSDGRLRVQRTYFRFNADLELTANLGGESVTARGQALYELLILH